MGSAPPVTAHAQGDTAQQPAGVARLFQGNLPAIFTYEVPLQGHQSPVGPPGAPPSCWSSQNIRLQGEPRSSLQFLPGEKGRLRHREGEGFDQGHTVWSPHSGGLLMALEQFLV